MQLKYIGIFIIGYLMQMYLCKLMINRGYDLTKKNIHITSLITGLTLICISCLKINPISFIVYFVTIIITINITIIDLKFTYIPIELNKALLITGAINALINYENIINYIGAFMVAGAAFWILAIVTGLGGGDVKLIAAIGLIVGYNSIIFIMCSSYIIGAIIGISLLIMRRKKLVSILPFAPFITISTILCFMVGFK